MIILDYESRIPIYEQIIIKIEEYVAYGILKPNEKIPSVRELATELGVNPNTVKKAYTELERKGVTKTLSTKGTFICESTNEIIQERIDEKIKEIKNIIEQIEKLGISKEDIINKILS